MTDLQKELLRAAPFDSGNKLCAKLGRKRGTVYKALERMVELGLLTSHEIPHYRLTDGKAKSIPGHRYDLTLKGIKLRREMRREPV